MKREKFLLILSVFASLLFVSSCFDDDDESLVIRYWQAPSVLNPYLSSGFKDVDASALVLEPLANYDGRGRLVPRPGLVERVPTRENNYVNDGVTENCSAPEGCTTVDWDIEEGVLWSDGTPFTVEDILFTYEYTCSFPGQDCDGPESSIERLVIDPYDQGDDLKFQIVYRGFMPVPYDIFVTASSPVLQKSQFEDCLGRHTDDDCLEKNLAPVGTGPYKVASFSISPDESESRVVYEPNENFRGRPPDFPKVIIEGGGDAESAAREVLETGEAHYGWNLQVDSRLLEDLEESGDKAAVLYAFSNLAERLKFNFANPGPELGDRRSEYDDGNNPHPILSDASVREALARAIDHEELAALYGNAGKVTCNVIPQPEDYVSRNTSCDQDIEEANRLLDEAGWRLVDGVRRKIIGGEQVRLGLLFQTSTNSIRQHTQEFIQGWWEEIGVETELKDINPSIFFGGDSLNHDDTYGKFYADVQMYASGGGVDPQGILSGWTSDAISGIDNDWTGSNDQRYSDEKYDELYGQLAMIPQGRERARKIIEMNDYLIERYVVVSLVHRGQVSAVSNKLRGILLNGWDTDMWNIHEWHWE